MILLKMEALRAPFLPRAWLLSSLRQLPRFETKYPVASGNIEMGWAAGRRAVERNGSLGQRLFIP